jgi:adenylate cyclase, class 2
MRHHETEIKLQVRNPAALKQRLAKLGFRPVRARHFERNVLFDFPDLRLSKSQCLLRLRFVEGESRLTFKGAPLRAPRYKIRREIEATVGDGRRVKEIFLQAGLREMFRYEKYRTVFGRARRSKRAGAPELVYDETPIGNYLELEGSRRWIDGVARQLGYGWQDYIPASYATLYRQHCLERGVKPGHMVFARPK